MMPVGYDVCHHFINLLKRGLVENVVDSTSEFERQLSGGDCKQKKAVNKWFFVVILKKIVSKKRHSQKT